MMSNPNKYIYFFLWFLILTSCQDETLKIDKDYNPIVANSIDRDLDAIKEDGILRALVVYSSTSYFLYRGQPMGFEYELLKQLADHLNLKLEIVVSKNLDNEFEVLNSGNVDLVAHGMTITKQRQWEVDFTEYLYLTRQVLVQRKPDNFRKLSHKSLNNAVINDPIELIGDTVSVRKNSSYFERLQSLSNEIGGDIIIDTLDSSLSTGEIIDKVVSGEIKYTIADENLAKINASYSPILKIDVPISLSQRIAWVTRKKSKQFKAEIDKWIRVRRNKKAFNIVYNKYFKNKRSFKRRTKSDYYSLTNNQISRYDDLIKSYAVTLDWDWRLLAAQVYQESRFDPTASSWAGAEGLMQVMPNTAQALNISDPSNPEQSLKGGTKYLKQLYEQFAYIPDKLNRIKFTMASYNCGLGHVQDAQRLATFNGLDQMQWEDSVEDMLLALRYPKNYNQKVVKYGYVRGSEPVNYIAQIFERYNHYKQFID